MSDLSMLLERFDGLIKTPADVAKLEQVILEWAMIGKLVPQVPSDEPASALLERIAMEKARLVEHGKIKARTGKKYIYADLTSDDLPNLQLPHGWE